MMIIFKKWKELKDKIKRYNDSYEVAYMSYKYKNVELHSPIEMNNIYLVKNKDDLIFFVKKDNWKKYIGFSRDYLCDSQGNDFSHDTYYKTTDLKQIKSCYLSDIPKELIKETEDELIKYKDDIKIVLEDKIKEEFYK